MRLRTTAPPNAFLMLNPKRLSGSWFTRKKTVKWELDRRFPVRYTASNSPLRTSRAARGKSRRPSLLGREPMASLLAARRQHLAAALRLHAYAKAVRLRAPPLPRLISPLWQSTPPLIRVERSRDFTFLRTNAAPRSAKSTIPHHVESSPSTSNPPSADAASRSDPSQSHLPVQSPHAIHAATAHSSCRSSESVPRAISDHPNPRSRSCSTTDRSSHRAQTKIPTPSAPAATCVDWPCTCRSQSP